LNIEEANLKNPDQLVIRNLMVRGIIGINDWERKNRQDIVVNLTLEVDTSVAARSDDIADSLNYRSLTKEVIAFVEASSFNLVEALAEGIAAVCVRDFGAKRAQVRVEKPGALRFAESVGVEIDRGPEDF
jgi:FolB domain-containing protein